MSPASFLYPRQYKYVPMKWIELTSEDQLEHIIKRSAHTPQVIFKHSVRCGISAVAKHRLEKKPVPDSVDFYFLNVIVYRSLSNKIAKELGVPHETPQILLIRDGQCVYTESHWAINMDEIAMAA
jgi:bacillithiol system protein YtxJ